MPCFIRRHTDPRRAAIRLEERMDGVREVGRVGKEQAALKARLSRRAITINLVRKEGWPERATAGGTVPLRPAAAALYEALVAAGLDPYPYPEISRYVLDFSVVDGAGRVAVALEERPVTARKQELVQGEGWRLVRFTPAQAEKETVRCAVAVVRALAAGPPAPAPPAPVPPAPAPPGRPRRGRQPAAPLPFPPARFPPARFPPARFPAAAAAGGGRPASPWPWVVVLLAVLFGLYVFFQEEAEGFARRGLPTVGPAVRALLGRGAAAPPAAAAPAGPGPAPRASQPPATLQALGPGTYRVTAAGPLRLEVTATGGPCWLRVYSDGAHQGDVTLEPGQSRAWSGQGEIRFRAGNPGVLRVRVNGQDLGVISRDGPIDVQVQAAPAEKS